MALATVLRPASSISRSARCMSPKTKSFVSSTPIWTAASAKYLLLRSCTTGAGHRGAGISSSRSCGDHPPKNIDRPPMQYARPGNPPGTFVRHGSPHTSALRHAGINFYRSGCCDPDIRQVLGVLSEHERACFENQDPMIPKLIAVEEVLRQGPAERAAAYDDDIEGPSIRSPRGAAHRLIKSVAYISAEYVLTEIRILRRWTCRHSHLLYLTDISDDLHVAPWPVQHTIARSDTRTVGALATSGCEGVHRKNKKFRAPSWPRDLGREYGEHCRASSAAGISRSWCKTPAFLRHFAPDALCNSRYGKSQELPRSNPSRSDHMETLRGPVSSPLTKSGRCGSRCW